MLQQKLAGRTSIAEASTLIRIAYECGMIHQMEAGRQTLQSLLWTAAMSFRLRRPGVIRADPLWRDQADGYGTLVPAAASLFMRACLFLLDGDQCATRYQAR